MTGFLINTIVGTIFFVGTLHSAILSKYKDGVSIDSLVENWRPTDYKTVKALLEKEKIEHSEEEDFSCDIKSSEFIITLHFNKVYYKGLYIGGGFMGFRRTPKERTFVFPIFCFRTEMPYSSVFNQKPKVNDIKACYSLMKNVYVKKFAKYDDSSGVSVSAEMYQEQPIDSIMKDYEAGKYYPDESLEIKNKDDKGRVKYRWSGRINRSNIYIFLFLNRKTPLEFQIGTITVPM